MSTKQETNTVSVVYKFVNGSHFFVGDDSSPTTKGLCVGSRNLEDAYHQVGEALTFLLAKNHGIKTDCHPVMSFETFKMILAGQIEQDFGAKLLGAFEPNTPPVPAPDGGLKLWTKAKVEKNLVPV